jgi:transglutaminase-like putative cysteine protease
LTFVGRDLPAGWSVTSSTPITGPTLQRFADNLGVGLVALSNEVLNLRGLPLQVNFIATETPAAAAGLAKALSAGGRAPFIAQSGAQVIEFAKMNGLAAAALRHELGLLDAEPRSFAASFALCPVSGSDGSAGTQALNLCLALEKDPADAAAQKALKELTRTWRYAETVQFYAGPADAPYTYDFVPAPVELKRDGELLLAKFGPLPKRHGLPCIEVRIQGQVRPRFEPGSATTTTPQPASTPPAAPQAAMPQSAAAQPDAPRWTSTAVSALAEQLCAGLDTPRARLEALAGHVFSQIRYDGPELGSRYGVDQVLTQGFGRCWDKSDLTIALCRAAGLPARQIAGWVPALASGHVWCEAYLEGQGWLTLDPTCPWLGTSSDYLPWFQNADGNLEIAYLSLPTIEWLSSPAR